MTQQKISNQRLIACQQAAARALKHAETALAQYSAAIRELYEAGEPVDWMIPIASLPNFALGVSRRLEAQVAAIFEKAIAKL